MLQSVPAKQAIEHQQEIFDIAASREIELAVLLEEIGMTYDDLIYEHNTLDKILTSNAVGLSDFEGKSNMIPFVSFFTGCGGMDLGFEAAGFCHTAAFEYNELFCKTLRRNRPAWEVYGPPTRSGDVSDFGEVVQCLDESISRPFPGVFVGGPPCQPFSIAANQRFMKNDDNFKRIGFEHTTDGGLLFDYVKIIEHYKPSCFVIENVAGLRDLDGGQQLAYALDRLEKSGYAISGPEIINAAYYGVPQLRERLFVVGTNNGNSFAFPAPSSGHTLPSCVSVLPQKREKLPNHETRNHKLSSILRYIKLKFGQRDHLGRVDRLDPTRPSKTVIAGGINGGGRSHLHPYIPRTLTVRECARLQTFPDDFIFMGPTARQFTQVGNAVPPVLAAQIAAAIAESVFGVSNSR